MEENIERIEESSWKDTLRQEPQEATRDAPLVQGGLWKAIWLMSWPLIISTVATSIVGIIDVQVSSYLTSAAQAAVGLSEQVIFMFVVFILSIGVGTTAIVSRAFGAGDREETYTATAQSLVISVVSGLLLSSLAISFGKYMLPVFTHSREVIEQGRLYLSIFSLHMIPLSIVSISAAAFRAIGDARTPLYIIVTDVVLHIAGDYLTVLHGWPVAGLGVRGIAASAVFSASVAALLCIVAILRSPLKKSLERLLAFDWDCQKRILTIGLPSAIQRLGWTGSVFAMFFILSRVPEQTAALASWTIGMRIESLLFMPIMALSLAVSSIVGQNLGADKPDRASKAGWNVTALGVSFMLVLGTLLFVLAPPVAHIMSQDPATIRFSISYMRINAFSEPFLAVAMILMGAMQGAGDTRANMKISLCCNWLIRLPVAWCLAILLNMGTDGVWCAMVTSVVCCSLWCSLRYRSGRWLLVKV